MKKVKIAVIGLFVLTVLALPFIVWAAPLVNDTYADSNSQNQDLANNSIRLFNARNSSSTVRTDAVGSVTFQLLSSANSDAFWGFFTDSGSPVNLKVGDKLTVSGTFVLTGFTGRPWHGIQTLPRLLQSSRAAGYRGLGMFQL